MANYQRTKETKRKFEWDNQRPPAPKTRIDGIFDTKEVFVDGKRLDPKDSQAIINHSPDGFNWGYQGSGPAQLALAILLDCLGRETALKYYQKFKLTIISRLPPENFTRYINMKFWQNGGDFR